MIGFGQVKLLIDFSFLISWVLGKESRCFLDGFFKVLYNLLVRIDQEIVVEFKLKLFASEYSQVKTKIPMITSESV